MGLKINSICAVMFCLLSLLSSSNCGIFLRSMDAQRADELIERGGVWSCEEMTVDYDFVNENGQRCGKATVNLDSETFDLYTFGGDNRSALFYFKEGDAVRLYWKCFFYFRDGKYYVEVFKELTEEQKYVGKTFVLERQKQY